MTNISFDRQKQITLGDTIRFYDMRYMMQRVRHKGMKSHNFNITNSFSEITGISLFLF